MVERELEIINKLGLHARASAKLVKTANGFASDTRIEFAGQVADAKSIMQVMMLAASVGSKIRIKTNGPDEQAAMEAIRALIKNCFDEEG